MGHSAFGVDRSSWQVHRISRSRNMLFQAGVLWVRRAAGFSGVLIGTKSLFCFRSIACNFAHRTPRLSAETSRSSRRRLARSSTRRVFGYHALTESSMSSTAGQPRNRGYKRGVTVRKKLRWPQKRAPKRIQAAQQQFEYIRMYKTSLRRGVRNV